MPSERESPDPTSALRAKSVRNATQAGALIGERYRLEGTLGRGGMGVVFAAVHVHTQRQVALKWVDCPWTHGSASLYQRFIGEARAAAAVRHPNVVDVLDMGYHEGAPYLVMERLAGESLEQILKRVGLLPLQTVLAWLLPIMGALAALHEKAIVHRDIKPSNIFLARGVGPMAVPKLLDFGLAQAASETALTQPGMTLGTPEYMAPERVRGLSVGPAADIWAMGVVLFECLCGRVPFSATDLTGVAAQVVAGDVLKTLDANPHVPPQVAAVIDRALALDPTQRHPDMTTFAYELARAARAAGVLLPPDPDPVGLPAFAAQQLDQCQPASAPLTHMHGTAPLTLQTSVSARPAQRRLTLALLSAAMLMAGAASWAAWPSAPARKPPPPWVAVPAAVQPAQE
ncbi:MAG TPA: serine/threonine-protein kinase, partial [Polyangiales bacterium]